MNKDRMIGGFLEKSLADLKGWSSGVGVEPMTLTLYCHLLASFCCKPLIALYENGTPVAWDMVDLGDPHSSAALQAHLVDRQVSGAPR